MPPEVEEDLVRHVLQLEKMFYGLTRQGLMKLAYEIAEKNKLKTRFNQETKSAGKEWYTGFIKRHPILSLRTPEATSLARAAGFNKTVVHAFFDIFETIIQENKITPDRLFNADETSHTVVQKPQKVIAQRGKHQVGAITSCERGQNVTGMYAMSASGVFIPPMLIFARKRMKESLVYGAPPGAIYRCQDKGWMDADGFYYWLSHFIDHTKPSTKKKVLLVLDGHSSHTQSLKAIELPRKNGIIMLSFPSHCTHRMQPLDVGFFKPLNTYFSAAITTRLHQFPGRALNVEAISSLVGSAFPRAATVEVAINSFRKTGLWPPDRHVFIDADFAAAEVSDRALENNLEGEVNLQEPQQNEEEPTPSTSSHSAYAGNCFTTVPQGNPTPSTSSHSALQPVAEKTGAKRPNDEDSPDSSDESGPNVEKLPYIPSHVIHPLPHAAGTSTGNRRKKKFNASGVNLTGTPYKDQLIIQQAPKTKTDVKKKKLGKRGLTNQGTNQSKEHKKLGIAKKRNKGHGKKPQDENKTDCLVCGEDYEEDWIMCHICKRWAHESCADLTDANYYYCDNCSG